MRSEPLKKKKLPKILKGRASVWCLPLIAVLSCGEQVIEDTRQVNGNNLKTANNTEGGASAQRVRRLDDGGTTSPAASGSGTLEAGQTKGTGGESVFPSSSPGSNDSTPNPTEPPGPTSSPGPFQSASPTPTASASASPTTKPAAWEPENIYRIVERNCMDACHLRTHSTQFKNKAIFLGAKSASIYRMTQTPNRPMPQAGTAPNFEPSGDKATLIEWLQQQ